MIFIHKILQALVYYNYDSKQKQTTKQNENTNDKRIVSEVAKSCKKINDILNHTQKLLFGQ